MKFKKLLPMPAETFIPLGVLAYVWFFIANSRFGAVAWLGIVVWSTLSLIFIGLSWWTERIALDCALRVLTLCCLITPCFFMN